MNSDLYILGQMLVSTDYKVELLGDALTTKILGKPVYAIQRYGHGFCFTFDAVSCIVTHVSVHGHVFQEFYVQNIISKLYEFFDLIKDVWEEEDAL